MKSQTQEVAFAPVDNSQLAMLCGALDVNLRQIVTALDVSIARRAERFSVTGEPGRMALAARALRRFYDLAANDLSLEDIQLGLVEVSRAPAEGGPESPDLRLPRKTELTARTPRQQKNAWYRHWIGVGLRAVEAMLAGDARTGAFCHGDTPGLADCCLVPQVFNARRFGCELSAMPTVLRIADHCAGLEAFRRAAPEAQPDAD